MCLQRHDALARLDLSRQFADCLRDLRTYYDFIVIDGPALRSTSTPGLSTPLRTALVTVCPAKGSQAITHMQNLFARKRFSAFATAPDR